MKGEGHMPNSRAGAFFLLPSLFTDGEAVKIKYLLEKYCLRERWVQYFNNLKGDYPPTLTIVDGTHPLSKKSVLEFFRLFSLSHLYQAALKLIISLFFWHLQIIDKFDRLLPESTQHVEESIVKLITPEDDTCGLDLIILKTGKLTNYTCDVIWESPSHGAKLIFWVIGIMWKFELSSFQKFLLWSPLILVSKNTNVQRLNKTIMVLIPSILQFHFLRHVTGFPRSHHICHE